MFLTTPLRIWPSLSEATSSERASARLSSRTARRETTMLPRERSILRIWNGCGEPRSGVMSRTGRISTWLPGRKATAPLRSTVKPPLTRPKIMPVTRSLAWKLFSSWVQASSRRAFSRDKEASPFLSSIRSRKTSTVSPTWISGPLPPAVNSLSGTRPSDLSPTSISATSLSIEMTRPLTTVPSRLLATPIDSSSSAAKFSFCVRSAMSVTAIPCPRSRYWEFGPAGIAAEQAAGEERVRPREPGPARRKEDPPARQPSAAVGGKCARDNIGSLFQDLVGIEPGRIQDNRIGCRGERGNPTLAVARVAFIHVLQDIAVYNRRAALPQLPEPAFGARLRARGDKELQIGVGTDGGADIAAVEHGAPSFFFGRQ